MAGFPTNDDPHLLSFVLRLQEVVVFAYGFLQRNFQLQFLQMDARRTMIFGEKVGLHVVGAMTNDNVENYSSKEQEEEEEEVEEEEDGEEEEEDDDEDVFGLCYVCMKETDRTLNI
ncbi:hypothetical protein ACLB2K_053954 [Fragaria x ananassa]